MGGRTFSRGGAYFKFWSTQGMLIWGEALIQGFSVEVCAPWLIRFLSSRMVLFLLNSCLTFDWEKDAKGNLGSRVKFGKKRKPISVSTTVLSSISKTLLMRPQWQKHREFFFQKTLPEKGRKLTLWFYRLFIFGLSLWSCHLYVDSACWFCVSVAF